MLFTKVVQVSSPMHKPSNPKFFEIVFFVCFDSPGPNAHPDHSLNCKNMRI